MDFTAEALSEYPGLGIEVWSYPQQAWLLVSLSLHQFKDTCVQLQNANMLPRLQYFVMLHRAKFCLPYCTCKCMLSFLQQYCIGKL